MIPITDEEAQDWPLEVAGHGCWECSVWTNLRCGHCGLSLCERLDCIKAHASKGCYNRHRHADDSRPNVNQDPPPHAGPQHDPSHASAEPALDGQAVEEPSIPKGR